MASTHPALTVTNIKTYIPILLETKTGKYTQWAELFKIHCRAFDCYEHLEHTTPSTPATSSSDKAAAPVDEALWKRVDSTVLQWIYGTIHVDLLSTVLKTDSNACTAWKTLKDVFGDNANSRALQLETQLVNTKLDNFPDVSSYCQALKEISDQLTNVNAPISNQRMVLQMISGLNEQYDGVAMLLQQTNPLPDFFEARSRLLLEETRKANQSSSSATALHASSSQAITGQPQSASSDQLSSRNSGSHGRGQGVTPTGQTGQYFNRNSGRNNSNRNRGGKSSYNRNRGRGGFSFTPTAYPPPWHPSGTWQWTPSPPVPYPTVPAGRPPRGRGGPPPSTAPGILGAPPQAYTVNDGYYTNVEQAMHTPTLYPDPNWYLDTGATHHMTHNTGLPDADTYPAM